MMNVEALTYKNAMRSKPKELDSLDDLEEEYNMAFWDGQEVSREEVINLRWSNTNLIERLKFFIQGRPIYKIKSMYYNNEFYTMVAIDKAVEQLNVGSIMIIKEEHIQKKYNDTWTRYLILDESCVTALKLML